MKRVLYFYFSLMAISGCLFAEAQEISGLKSAMKKLDARQSGFNRKLATYKLDPGGKNQLKRFIGTETDSIQQLIVADQHMAVSQKILALDCQSFLLDTIQASLGTRAFNISLISDSRENFIPLWQLMAKQRSCEAVMKPFKPQTAGLMAAVFRPFPQSDRLQDIADLKLMRQHPQLIIPFLSSSVDFYYRDSLLYILANTLPEKIPAAINESKNEELKRIIRHHPDRMVKTLVMLSDLKDLGTYLPFLPRLAEGKMSVQEIEALRSQPCEYFKELVDDAVVVQANSTTERKFDYQIPLKKYVKEYSIRFFTDIINLLHDELREKDRYFVLDDLRPQDLYYIIANGENDLYTSSYLYTYRKLMGLVEGYGADSLLRLVHFDQYRKFLLMAGRYNTLVPFLKNMSNDQMMNLLAKMMAGLENAEPGDLEEVINVAESFPGLLNDEKLLRLAKAEIQKNLYRCRSLSSDQGSKVYTLLSDLLNTIEVQQDDQGVNGILLFNQYYGIPYPAFTDPDGSINELAVFYGDEDGQKSFNSFIGQFNDVRKWTVDKNTYWARIRSTAANRLTIYANLPLSDENNEDEKARDSLSSFLKHQGIYPRILIHRGHSYHMHESFIHLNANTKLVIMGSCGSYTEIADILEKSPEAQVISSKQMGSMQVNEPMIGLINDKLTSQLDLYWPAIWQELGRRFSSNKYLDDFFKAYVPPYKNIAQMAINRYRQLNEQ